MCLNQLPWSINCIGLLDMYLINFLILHWQANRSLSHACHRMPAKRLQGAQGNTASRLPRNPRWRRHLCWRKACCLFRRRRPNILMCRKGWGKFLLSRREWYANFYCAFSWYLEGLRTALWAILGCLWVGRCFRRATLASKWEYEEIKCRISKILNILTR